MLAFGANLTGFNIVNYFARNVDKILIGRSLGAAPLGLYSNAYRLLLLPVQQISTPLTSVAIPALSRLQDQRDRFRAYYRRGVMLTVAAGMPVVAFLFVSADKAVLTFLGSQWLDAVPIFRALGPAAFIGTFNMATGWVYVSTGTTRRQFQWGIFASTTMVFAYIVGLQWGVIGVAIAYSVVLIVLRFPSVVYCFHGSHLRVRDLGVALWRPATASIVAGILLYATGLRLVIPGPVALSLVTDLVIYLVFYFVVWLLLPKGRRSVGDIMAVVKDLRPAPPETKDEHDDQKENG